MLPSGLWLPTCSPSPEVLDILAVVLAPCWLGLCASSCRSCRCLPPSFWSDPGTPLALSELVSCALASIRGADGDSVLSKCSPGSGVGQ